MENIFEGVKFGDKFLTRDGKVARYICCNDNHIGEYKFLLLIEEKSIPYYYDEFGKYQVRERQVYDIVSRYQEPIDEKKLDELAENENQYIHNDYLECDRWYGFQEGFKVGYRKAKEE